MADKDPEQENLFKEIDEELRQEQYATLWKKYGNYIIGLIVILVGSVAAFQGWKAYDQNRRADDSALYSSALKADANNKSEEALSILTKLQAEGTEGYALLARFNKAAILAGKGDTAAASAEYTAIAVDQSIDQIYRDLATVFSALQELDKGDPSAISGRLQPLLSPSNPFRHTAKEIAALLAHRQGKVEDAKKLFRELADDVTAPGGVRARAAEMSAILGG